MKIGFNVSSATTHISITTVRLTTEDLTTMTLMVILHARHAINKRLN